MNNSFKNTKPQTIDLNFARIDILRKERRGFPEIIYSSGKTTQQLIKIIREFKKYEDTIILSRLSYSQYKVLKKVFPKLKYFKLAKIGFLGKKIYKKKGNALVITAGTADIPVAEEAAVFLELTGNNVERIYDVGASGLHRLEPFKEKIKDAKVIIVVAGMEAALLSIVSGLTKAVVIGVPTSFGYGASFGGLSALLGMLNCCSLGTVVVNIDGGLAAGYFANLINR
ncbi:MAG: nickel pincer cofactor biosynthesis protein LarB [Candidatus Omnitrophica bacterium]|nr:nickel pincer cofactor biosynthesis protein LarB [Candidatus Omnitrophota bacterium]